MKIFRQYLLFLSATLVHHQQFFRLAQQLPIISFFTAGFDVYKSSNLKAVREYIKFVDERFKLVMFTEYFDESLVLLRRTMNWSMAGMVSIKGEDNS